MKKITFEKMLDTLENDSPEVLVDPEIAKRALIPIERMFRV